MPVFDMKNPVCGTWVVGLAILDFSLDLLPCISRLNLKGGNFLFLTKSKRAYGGEIWRLDVFLQTFGDMC